jgi:hypothetical protein
MKPASNPERFNLGIRDINDIGIRDINASAIGVSCDLRSARN